MTSLTHLKNPADMDMVELEAAYNAADETAERCYRDRQHDASEFWSERAAVLGKEIDRREEWIAFALARAESPVREVTMYGD